MAMVVGPEAGRERVDVVDEHDRVLRTVTRAEMRAEHLRHRATYVLVLSSRDELLVHQRSPHKDVYPAYWDVAAGGVLGHGEEWDTAAARELIEELGVEAPLEPLGTGTFADEHIAVNGRVYLARHDGPFTFTDDEVVQTAWVPLAAVEEAITDGRSWCPDGITLALPLLLARVRSGA